MYRLEAREYELTVREVYTVVQALDAKLSDIFSLSGEAGSPA
jgi:hypothetical protein